MPEEVTMRVAVVVILCGVPELAWAQFAEPDVEVLYTLTYVTCFHILILYLNLYVLLRVAGAGGLASLCGATIGLVSGNTEASAQWIAITAAYSWFPLLIAGMIRLLQAPLSFGSIALFSLSAALICTANPAQPVTTLAELVAAAKAKPRRLTYGSPGVGTPHHLSMALVETATGIELLHVPYRGTAGAVQDLLGGQIGYMFLPVHVSAQHIRAGRLKALAAGSPQRLPQLPELPTLAEQGLAGIDVDMWYGLFAPRGTPADLVERLNREVASILAAPEAGATFEAQGLVPTSSTPGELATIVARDRTRWAEVVAKRGIVPE